MYKEEPARAKKRKDPMLNLMMAASSAATPNASDKFSASKPEDMKIDNMDIQMGRPSASDSKREAGQKAQPRLKKSRETSWSDNMFVKEEVLPLGPSKQVRGGLAQMLDSAGNSEDGSLAFMSPSYQRSTRRGDRSARTEVEAKMQTIKVIFQELMDHDEPPLLVPFTDRTTVEDLMNVALYQHARSKKPKLAGQMAEQYELRLVDEDDSEVEIEMDFPALGTDKRILELNITIVGMCFKGKLLKNEFLSSPDLELKNQGANELIVASETGLDQESAGRGRRESLVATQWLNNGTTIGFIRVEIPGPLETSVTLLLDQEKECSLQDLFPMINKKLRQNLVNPEFFCFHYFTNTRLKGGPLRNSMSTLNLTGDRLILLPTVKVCEKMRNQRGYGSGRILEEDDFTLISILRPMDFQVWKLRDNSLSKKKRRTLRVGRYLIHKIAKDDGHLLKKDHLPIEVGKITRCDLTPRCKRIFVICYLHINGRQRREQSYEAQSEEQSSQIVDKINYFRQLTKYYGSEDPNGEVVKARKGKSFMRHSTKQ